MQFRFRASFSAFNSCLEIGDSYIPLLASRYEYLGVGDGGQGGTCPPQIREKYFSGNYYVKFGHFSGKHHVKFGNFVHLSGKNHVKFGHFVDWAGLLRLCN